MTTHSKTFPPSGGKAWMACPAWKGSDKTSIHADFGSVCHDWAEKWLIGQKEPTGMPPEIKPIILPYVGYCLEAMSYSCGHLIEETVQIEATGEFGTIDFAYYYFPALDRLPVLEVVDLKTGKSYVSPKKNPQLMQYALGVIDMFVDQQFEKVVLTIWQRDKLRQHEMLIDELLAWRDEELTPAVEIRLNVLNLPDDEKYMQIRPNHGTCFFCGDELCLRDNFDAINDF